MIFVDSSELRSNSRFARLDGIDAQESQVLESVTGADVMISTKSLPASNETLVRHHVQHGAILIQLKFGSDIVSSIITERINIALARMIEAGAKHQYQRMILAVGLYLPDFETGKVLTGKIISQKRGSVVCRWRDTEPEVHYKAFASARRRIAMRGGTFLNVTCDDEVPGELASLEHDLKLLSSNPTKTLFHTPGFPPDPPDPGDPLQIPIEVKDGRRVIAGFSGIGQKKANDLWAELRKHNEKTHPLERGFTEEDWEPTLSQALTWMTEWDRKSVLPKKIPGWGKGTIKSIREQMGMVEGLNFHYYCYDPEIGKE